MHNTLFLFNNSIVRNWQTFLFLKTSWTYHASQLRHQMGFKIEVTNRTACCYCLFMRMNPFLIEMSFIASFIIKHPAKVMKSSALIWLVGWCCHETHLDDNQIHFYFRFKKEHFIFFRIYDAHPDQFQNQNKIRWEQWGSDIRTSAKWYAFLELPLFHKFISVNVKKR